MSQNGESAEDLQKRQEEMALLDGAQAGHESAKQLHETFLEELKETDLSEGSKQILRNLISPDFIFAYYNDKEIHELKYTLEIKKKQFYDMHPAQECEVVGDDRAYINDDEHDDLRSLSDSEIMVVETFFSGVYARITRAKEMKQQEILQTSISENRVQRGNDDDENRGLRSKLPG